jgi:DNA-binding response OmpR family regulator
LDDPEPAGCRAFVFPDSALLVGRIELALHHARFVVRAAGTLIDARGLIADWRPDLAILDMDHPDGARLLALLVASRAGGAPITILGLVRRHDIATALRTFELGATDIVSMPFTPDELVARAIVGSRRATGRSRPVVPSVVVGEVELDIVGREVRTETAVVHLTGLDQSLLYLLASRAGEVVTRQEICAAIWGDGLDAMSTIVDRQVRSLRVKLQDDDREPRLIATVPGRGYRLEAGAPAFEAGSG